MTVCAGSTLRADDGRDYQASACRSYVDRHLWASQNKISLHLRLDKGEDCEIQYGMAFFFTLSLKNVMCNDIMKSRLD